MAKARSAKGSDGTLTLPVNYGNVSVGDETARIGVSISRANLTVGQADRYLCCKRLRGRLICGQPGDSPGQASLVPDPELTGMFDCKKFSAGGKAIQAGLTFALNSVDLALLAGMAKRSGRVVIEGVENIPEEEPRTPKNGEAEDDEDGEEGEDEEV